MRKCLIAIVSAGLVLLVIGVRRGDVPSQAWSAPLAERPAAKDARPGGKPTDQPKAKPREEPLGPEEDWKPHASTKPLTEEQEKEALDYLKQKRPEIYEQVIEQREKEPRRYRNTIRSIYHFVTRMKTLPENVRAAYETRQSTYVKMWRLACQCQTAEKPAAKADLEKQLLELAKQQFEADQIVRQHRLAQLAEQIQQLERELKERARDRQAVVREIAERMKKSAERYSERREGKAGGDQPASPTAPDKKPPQRKQDGPRAASPSE